MLLWCRHGQTEPNRAGQLLGRSDPGLTERGIEQAHRLAGAVAALEPVALFSSQLQRARQTADIVAGECGLAVEVDEQLVEIDYGEWEGRPFAELDPAIVKAWRTDADFAPPGGETLRDVTERAASFCERRVDDRVIVAVSHVSPIKGAVTWALGVSPELAWRMRLDVASITRIGPGPSLLSFNETAHLL